MMDAIPLIASYRSSIEGSWSKSIDSGFGGISLTIEGSKNNSLNYKPFTFSKWSHGIFKFSLSFAVAFIPSFLAKLRTLLIFWCTLCPASGFLILVQASHGLDCMVFTMAMAFLNSDLFFCSCCGLL